MKTGNGRTLTVVAILATALVAFGGCENFMSKDKSFKESIENEVRVANAAQFDVQVLAVSGQATTSPTGKSTQKVDVPFTVLVQPSEAYGFIEWQAFSTTDTAQESPLDSSVIAFADAKALTTDVTIHVARNDILIQPKTDKRPKLSSTSPGNGTDKVFQNVPIRLYFSKPMSPSAFLFSDGSAKQGSGKDVSFSNITMIAQRGTGEPESCEYKYKPPVLDKTGKILTITPIAYNDPDTKITTASTVTIECSLLVTDTFGIKMPESTSFSFKYGANADSNPPTVDSLVQVKNPDNSYWADTEANRHYAVTKDNSVIITLNVKDGTATAPESDLAEIYILEKRITDDQNVACTNVVGETVPFNDGVLDGGNYDIKYTFQTTGDGKVQLSFWALDTTGNSGIENPVTYVYYRDTTPPVTDPTKIILTNPALPATANYYNIDAHTLNFTESAVDTGANDYASKADDVKAQIQLVSSDGLQHVESLGWFNGSTSIEIPSLFPDGIVTINYRLIDKVGNVSSGWALKGTVLKDTNRPTGTIAVENAKSNGTTTYLQASGTPVKVNLNAFHTDGESAIVSYKVAETTSSSADKTTLYNNVRAVNTGTYGSGPYTTDITVSDNATHYFYAWFKDAAGNETPAASPMVSVVASDDAAPTIDDFTVTRSSTDTSRYNNTNTWYFSITATDNASGVANYEFAPVGTVTGVNRQTSGNSVTFTGTYTYTPSTTSEEVPLKVKVGDYIGNATSSRSLDAAKRVFYDKENPTGLTAKFYDNDGTVGPGSKDGINYYYDSSNYLYTNQQDGHKLVLSLSDASSGAASYSITSGLSNPATNKPFDGASPGSAGEKTSTYTANLESIDTTILLGINGSDYAKNPAVSITRFVHVDKTPPTFNMKLTDFDAATTILTKAANNSNATTAKSINGDTDTRFKNMGSFIFTVSNIVDSRAGFKSASYPWKLYRYVDGGSGDLLLDSGTFNSLTTAGADSAKITIPTVNAGSPTPAAQPSSGRYYISFKLKDNLENENTEQRIGYVYDERAPYVPVVQAFKEDGAVLPYIGSSYWIDGTNLYLRAQATDTLNDTTNSAHDQYGSGISTVTVNAQTYSKSANTAFSDSSPIRYESSLTGHDLSWIDVGFMDGSVVKKTLGPVSGTGGTYSITFADAMGNTTAKSLSIKTDTAGPMCNILTYNLNRGFEADVLYLNSSATTALCPNYTDSGSGLRAWIMSVSSEPIPATTIPATTDLPVLLNESDMTAYANAWTAYMASGVSPKWQRADMVSPFTTTYAVPEATSAALFHDTVKFPDAALRYIRFYAIDFAGNISSSSYLDQKFKMDTTKPSVTGIVVNDDARATNDANRRVKVKVTASDSGSGLLDFAFTGLTLESVTTITGSSGKVYDCTVSTDTTTLTFIPVSANRNPLASESFELYGALTTGNGEKTVSVTAHDAVMNASDSGVNTSDTIIYDAEPPVLASTLKIAGLNGNFVDNETIDLEIPITTEGFSGIKEISFDDSVSRSAFNSCGAVTGVTKRASKTPVTGYTISGNTIQLPPGLTAADTPLVIYGVTLDTGFTNGTIALRATDYAGNTSNLATKTGLVLDKDKPTGISLSLSGAYSTTGTVTATVMVTENGSGVETFQFDGATTASAAITGYSVKHPSENPNAAIQLDIADASAYPKSATSQTFTISGLTLDDPTVEGLKNVKVVVKDLASNASSDSNTASITYDPTSPSPPNPVHDISGHDDEWFDGAHNTYYVQATKNLAFTVATPNDNVATGHTGNGSGVPTTGYKFTTAPSYSSPQSFTSGGSLSPLTRYFWSVDNAGNVSSDYTTLKIIVDGVAPPAPIVTPVDDANSEFIDPVWYCQSSLAINLAQGTGGDAASGHKRFGYCTKAAYNAATPNTNAITWTVPSSITDASEAVNGTEYYFFAQDNVGNISAPTSLTVRKDATKPPVPTVSAFTGSGAGTTIEASTNTFFTSLNSVVLTLTSADGESGTASYAKVNGDGSFSAPNLTFTFSNDDQNTCHVTATDKVGNVSDQATIAIRRDSAKPANPVITRVELVDSEKILYEKDPNKEYYTTDDSLKITFSAGSDPTASASGFKRFEASDGTQTITSDNAADVDIVLPVTTSLTSWVIKSYDRVLNECVTSATVKIQKDLTIPGVVTVTEPSESDANSFEKPADYWYASSNIQFALSAGDDVDVSGGSSGRESYYYTKHYGTTTVDEKVTGSTVTITPTATATTYTFYSKDFIGNISSNSATFTVILDDTAPNLAASATTITADVPVNVQKSNDTYFKAGTFSFTPSDVGSGPGLYRITNSSTADATVFASGTSTWTSGTPVGPLNLQDFVPENDSKANVVYLHLIDNVGNISHFQILLDSTHYNWWYDTKAPSCTELSAPSGFYYTDASDTTNKATLYYKEVGSGVSLVKTAITDPCGLTSTPAFTAVELVSGSKDITMADSLGNSRTVKVTCTADAVAPEFTYTLSTFYHSGPDYLNITAKDTGSGLPAYVSSETKFKAYYRKDDLVTDQGDSHGWNNGTGWVDYYVNGEQTNTIDLKYDGTQVTADIRELPASSADWFPNWDNKSGGDNIDYFAVKASDNVGNYRFMILKRDTSSAVSVKPTFTLVGTEWSASRRNFVPQQPGTVGAGYEIENASPLNNAWSATGDTLIDWTYGIVTPKPVKNPTSNATLAVTPKSGKNAISKVKPLTTIDSTGKSVEELHRIVLGASVSTESVNESASNAVNNSFVSTDSIDSTQLLPDSVVEARVSVIAPLAARYLALRGVRLAMDPETEARNKLVALVQGAGSGGISEGVDPSQAAGEHADTLGNAAVTGAGWPLAGIVPGEKRRKG